MIECAKLNGNGNDFIAVDNMDMRYGAAELRDFAVKLCRRRESIGADGLLVGEPSGRRDFKMRIFNSDGSEGEMCGNGARCMARFAFEKNIVKQPRMVFETLSGDVSACVKDGSALINLAPVDLTSVVSSAASADGFDFQYTFLTVGVPHVVIFQEFRDREDGEYRRLGEAVRYMTDLFPEGANVDFVFPMAKENELFVLTYERGVEDLTLSCGTGSTASVVAACLSGRTGPAVDVWNPGGLNRVTLELVPGKTALPSLEGAVKYVADLSLGVDALK